MVLSCILLELRRFEDCPVGGPQWISSFRDSELEATPVLWSVSGVHLCEL